MAPAMEAAASPFQSVESDLASRTLRMTNFPASWVAPGVAEAQLVAKIRSLLGKFGDLAQTPTVSNHGTRSVIASATFVDASAAAAAAETLHNVDNRTEAEKRKANHAPPTDGQRFFVQVTAKRPRLEEGPGAAQGPSPSRVRISDLPLEWSVQDIEELCRQYGAVHGVSPDGPGRFVVVFAAHETAEVAFQSLDGLQVQIDVGFTTLTCEILTDDAPPESKQVYDPEAAAELDRDPPFPVYIDEVQLAVGDPEPSDREIYLRDLPLEDYSEPQLREWLDSFGRTDRVHFVTNPTTRELTGRGYARFLSHEEAAGLIAAFPVDDAEGNVQGTWSLSERVLKGAQGRLLCDLQGSLPERLKVIGDEFNCTSLTILAEGLEGGATFGLVRGPLCFVARPRSAVEGREDKLRARLASLVGEMLADPALFPRRAKKLAETDAAQASGGRGDAARGAGDADEDASSAAGDEAEANAERPTTPCIAVRGFPASWTEQQVRLVFALFGGVANVRFAKRGRAAYVELKIPENMEKAVEQLHNTQVGDGDLIEECTVACELISREGKSSTRPKGPTRKVIFVDDLPMPRRPDLPPRETDREVFLSSLPVKDCSEDQIRSWLEGFGTVEDMVLLKDPCNGELSGRGYVRFATHREARACVEAQASVGGAEEEAGDVTASWSESERAMQRAGSPYSLDVHTAFAGPSGRVLASILVSAKMKELWMLSDVHQPRDRGAPKPAGRQLHFIACCEDEHLEDLRKVLSGVLQTFHEKVARRARESKEPRDKDDGVDAMDPSMRRPANAAPPEWDHPGGGAGPQPPWDQGKGEPWRGYPPPGAPWYDWHGRPPPGWFPPGAGPPPDQPRPGYQEWRGQSSEGQPPNDPAPRGAPPWGHPKAGPPPQASTPDSAATPGQRSRARVDSGREPSREAVRSREKVDDDFEPSLQARIDKGERLVLDGKSAADRRQIEKAYEKYCRGLQYLLDVMPKIGEELPKAKALRLRINGYLDEAEKLKQQLDAAEAGTDKPVPRDTPVAKQPSSGRGARSPARRDDKAVGIVATDELLRHRVERGEALILEGQDREAANNLNEAYEKYCRGLQFLLEVMPKLGENSPEVDPLRAKISGYLERAEQLKERLEAQEQTAPGSTGGEPGQARGSRSRGRRRHGHGHRHHRDGEHRPRGERSRSRSRRRHRDRGDRGRPGEPAAGDPGSPGRRPGGGKGHRSSQGVPATRMKAPPTMPSPTSQAVTPSLRSVPKASARR